MEKKVQLKEQEVVGQETVFTDIYPKTDLTSIEDPSTGNSLDVTLDRLADLINDKLTRVVNSVNDRTGVVVLDAEDVGLGNVDNISFADIKDWVINTIETYLKNQKLRLFNTSQDLMNVINTNDEIHDNTSFFVQMWDVDGDKRSAIGVMTYDESDGTLTESHRYLNVIQETDTALKYYQGKLEVQISKSEEALKKVEDGLKIDGSKIRHDIHVFEAIYAKAGTGISIGDDSGFLLPDDTSEATAVKCQIYINHQKMVTNTGSDVFYLHPEWATAFDDRAVIIIESPSSVYLNRNEMKDLSSNSYAKELKYQPPLIGQYVHTLDDVMVLSFQTFTPFTTWGLNTIRNNGTANSKYNAIEVGLAGDGASSESKKLNYSNLQIMSTIGTEVDVNDGFKINRPPNVQFPMNRVMTPEGVNPLYTQNTSRRGGLFVPTDASLCAMPYSKYGLTPEQQNVPDYDFESNLCFSKNDKRIVRYGFKILTPSNHTEELAGQPLVNCYDENDNFILKIQLPKLNYDTGELTSISEFSWFEVDYDTLQETYHITRIEYAAKHGANVISDDTLKFDMYRITNRLGRGSKTYENWFSNTPYYADQDLIDSHSGFKYQPSFMGINLLKSHITQSDQKKYAVPLSGLKVIDPHDSSATVFQHDNVLTWKTFGLHKEVDQDRFMPRLYKSNNETVDLTTDMYNLSINSSGGLMLNVGKGLEILPGDITNNGALYNDSGKVNVRLGEGLTFDKYDRVRINDSILNLQNGVVQKPIQFFDGFGPTEQQVSVYASESAINNVAKFEKDDLNAEYQITDSISSRTVIQIGSGLKLLYDKYDLISEFMMNVTIEELRHFEEFGVFPQGRFNIDQLTYAELYKYITSQDTHEGQDGYWGLLPCSSNVTDLKDHQDFINEIFSKKKQVMRRYPYSKETVESGNSLTTLCFEAVDSGLTVSQAKQKTVAELIEIYKSRHPEYTSSEWEV